MRREAGVVTCALLLLMVILLPGMPSGQGGGESGRAGGPVNVYEHQIYKDMTVIANYDVHVHPDATLILENVTLWMNGTYEWYGITVDEGGRMFVRNSTIRSGDPDVHYKFQAFGHLTMLNTVVTDVWGNLERENGEGGIELHSDGSSIAGCDISEGVTNGVYCNASGLTISDSHIHDNYDDGVELQEAEVTVEGCNLSYNGWGLVSFDSDCVFSGNTVFNNNRTNHSQGAYFYSSTVEVRGCTFMRNGEGGIELRFSEALVMDNTFMEHQEYNYMNKSESNSFGILASNCTGTIAENVFTDNTYNVVAAWSEIDILYNVISGGWYGIQYNLNSTGLVSGNTISDCWLFSLEVLEANATLVENTIVRAKYSDIFLRGCSPFIYDQDVEMLGGLYSASPTIWDSHAETYSFDGDCHLTLINSTVGDGGIDLGYDCTAAVKWYVDIRVVDKDGGPVPHAWVTFYPADGSRANKERMDIDGTKEDLILTQYIKAGPGFWYSDSRPPMSNRTPYVVYANRDGFGSNLTTLDFDNNTNITIVLDPDGPPPNERPVLGTFFPEYNPELRQDQWQLFSINATDDGLLSDLTYRWYIDDALFQEGPEGAFNFSAYWLETGMYELEVRVSDGEFTESHVWSFSIDDTYPWVDDGDGGEGDGDGDGNGTSGDPGSPSDPDIDEDDDAMPDVWEEDHFGGTDHEGDGDTDGDGYTDLEEYFSDTDPNDPVDSPGGDTPEAPDRDQEGGDGEEDDGALERGLTFGIIIILLVAGILLVLIFQLQMTRTAREELPPGEVPAWLPMEEGERQKRKLERWKERDRYMMERREWDDRRGWARDGEWKRSREWNGNRGGDRSVGDERDREEDDEDMRRR